MSSRILFVEDEPGVALVVGDLLRAQGHTVETAPDGVAGLEQASRGRFDLLILDVMLPRMSGLDLCHAVRERGFDGAILILTAKGQVSDRVRGLQIGADDYLVKPYDSDELLARVASLLRRIHKAELTPVIDFQFGNVRVNFAQGEFSRQGKPIELASKETELLRFLINRRGQVVSREEILKQVWSEQQFITERTVDVHIAWLRQKVEKYPQSPRHIITVRGEGYRFER